MTILNSITLDALVRLPMSEIVALSWPLIWSA
jgi:hypothetical protein